MGTITPTLRPESSIIDAASYLRMIENAIARIAKPNGSTVVVDLSGTVLTVTVT
jgi:hypothetical protein